MKCNNNDEKQNVPKFIGNKPHSAKGDMNSILGLVCPQCQNATLEIDAQMNLVCQNCHYIIGGSFT